MNAWEIWTGDVYGPHPVVLISCQARIDAKPEVVVLKCSTMRPERAREAKENETVLDRADGLDWQTLCRCDLLFTIPKETLTNRRGVVSPNAVATSRARSCKDWRSRVCDR